MAPKRDRLKKNTRRKCSKCKDLFANIRSRGGSLCKECFLTATTHNFKKRIRGCTGVSRGDSILIAFSGGFASRALLHLVQDCLEGSGRGKMMFEAQIVHIDESALAPLFMVQLEAESEALELEIVAEMQGYGYPYFVHSILEVFPGRTREEQQQALFALFKQLESLEARQDMLCALRRKLLVRIAAQMGIPKLLVGDSATRVTNVFMSNICKGMGYSVPQSLQYIDRRFFSVDLPVQLLLPLRDFVAKELAVYCRYRRLRTQHCPSFATLLRRHPNPRLSVAHLTEALLASLQTTFPSTAYTVLRTGLKLKLPAATLPAPHPAAPPTTSSSVADGSAAVVAAGGGGGGGGSAVGAAGTDDVPTSPAAAAAAAAAATDGGDGSTAAAAGVGSGSGDGNGNSSVLAAAGAGAGAAEVDAAEAEAAAPPKKSKAKARAERRRANRERRARERREKQGQEQGGTGGVQGRGNQQQQQQSDEATMGRLLLCALCAAPLSQAEITRIVAALRGATGAATGAAAAAGVAAATAAAGESKTEAQQQQQQQSGDATTDPAAVSDGDDDDVSGVAGSAAGSVPLSCLLCVRCTALLPPSTALAATSLPVEGAAATATGSGSSNVKQQHPPAPGGESSDPPSPPHTSSAAASPPSPPPSLATGATPPPSLLPAMVLQHGALSVSRVRRQLMRDSIAEFLLPGAEEEGGQ